MTEKQTKKRISLENEVIYAVAILYIFIAVVMIVIHYIQPLITDSSQSANTSTESQQKSKDKAN